MMEWWNSGRWYFFGLRRFLQNFAGVTELHETYGEFGGPLKTRVFQWIGAPRAPIPSSARFRCPCCIQCSPWTSSRPGTARGAIPAATEAPFTSANIGSRPICTLRGHRQRRLPKIGPDVAKSNVFRAPRWPPTLRPWHGSRASAASPSTTTRGRWRTTCCHAMAAAVERQQLRGRVVAGCDARGIRVEFGPRWRTGDTG